MIKIINTFLSAIGATTLCFVGMVVFTNRDYLEILVVSGMVGAVVGLFNMLNMEEAK